MSISKEGIGQFYVKDNKLYKLNSYCESPTANLQNIVTGENIGGAVGCRNLEGFRNISELSKEDLLEVTKELSNIVHRKGLI